MTPRRASPAEPATAPLERLMLLWDELDDLVGLVRHALRATLGGTDLKNR